MTERFAHLLVWIERKVNDPQHRFCIQSGNIRFIPEPAMPLTLITLIPSRIARLLGVVALVLVLAGILSHLIVYFTGHNYVFGMLRLFNLNEEQNIPTFFSTVLLLFATLLLAVIAAIRKNQSAADLFYWSVLALGFLYLAADEAASIHELANSPVRNLFNYSHPGVFYAAWVIPAAVLITLAGLFFRGFLRRLPSKTRMSFISAAAIYIVGAVGIELLEGRYGEWHTGNPHFNALVVLEEMLEMAGVIVFIWALLVYMTDHFKHVGFQFLQDGEPAESLPDRSVDSRDV